MPILQQGVLLGSICRLRNRSANGNQGDAESLHNYRAGYLVPANLLEELPNKHLVVTIFASRILSGVDLSSVEVRDAKFEVSKTFTPSSYSRAFP